MQIVNRWSSLAVRLYSTRRYMPEEIRDMCRRINPPLWLNVGDGFIPLDNEQSVLFACQVCAHHHNSISYNVPPDDGFSRDMAEREARMQEHMEEESSSDDDDVVTEEQDMVYEKEFYI